MPVLERKIEKLYLYLYNDSLDVVALCDVDDQCSAEEGLSGSIGVESGMKCDGESVNGMVGRVSFGAEGKRDMGSRAWINGYVYLVSHLFPPIQSQCRPIPEILMGTCLVCAHY